MALQTSGAISLNQIHVEAGGTSGTTVSLNDSDVRGLTAASGYTINATSGTMISIGDFYGASAGTSMTLTQGEAGTTIDGFSQGYGTATGTYGSLSPNTLNGASVRAIYYFEYVVKGSYTRQFWIYIAGNRAQDFFATIEESSLPGGSLATSSSVRQYNSQYNYTSWYWAMASRPTNWDGSGNLSITFT